jgi:hypothetical protein
VRTTVLNDTCSGSGNYARIYQPYIGGTTHKLDTVVSGNLSVMQQSAERLELRHRRESEARHAADISPESGRHIA